MNKRDIAKAYIQAVTNVLIQTKTSRDNLDRFKTRLSTNHLSNGVCAFACRLGKSIASKKYVEEHAKVNSFGEKNHNEIVLYWFKVPNYAKTKQEAIELLNKRVEILKTWL